MTKSIEPAAGPRRFAEGLLARRSDLGSAAQLLHDSSFDRIDLQASHLAYEPRSTCQCKACAALWIASKSGGVMRIALATASGQPEQTWLAGGREARTVYHLHDGTALGGGSFLLIGRVDGTLDILSDQHPAWEWQTASRSRRESPGSIHLDSWWGGDELFGDELSVEASVPPAPATHPMEDPRARLGITAIAAIARPGMSSMLDLLVATGYPWLYVIEAANGRMRVRQRLAMPGWIQWIFRQPDDDIVCVSRGGDIVRFSHAELLDGGTGEWTELPLLPTAAMPWDGRGILLGTTDGLVMVSDEHPEGVAVPITRSPVLCLDRIAMESGGERREYVVMGLEDGGLRVTDAEQIWASVSGRSRSARFGDDFAIDLGEAVLAIETLQPFCGPRDAAYVLAVLRNHAVELFQVTSHETVHARAVSLWEAYAATWSGMGEATDRPVPLTAEFAAARTAPAGCEPRVWNAMLVDVVLPRLRQTVRDGSLEHRDLIHLACEITRDADRRVLAQLTDALGPLAGDDVALALELSRAILRAIPRNTDRWWSKLIERHLRALHALARKIHVFDRESARLVSWARFIRKYILLGSSFAAKQRCLLEHVEQSYETHKYFDALIYQTQLSQRGHDLRWENTIGEDLAGVHIIAEPFPLVVAVTAGAQLVFLETNSGRRLRVVAGGNVLGALAPFGHGGRARTLAWAVAVDDDVIRVVLSGTGPNVPPPGLVVCELRSSSDRADLAELHAEVFTLACDSSSARAYALQPLPGRPYAFVAGLDLRISPVGFIERDRAGRWNLELAADDAESLGPTVRTRALAVAATDDGASRYLVVTGSDDGQVCATSFAWGDPASRWKIQRWDRAPDPVTSIVLGRYRPSFASDPDDALCACYVGSAAGDIFALALVAQGASSATESCFGEYEARPLWRDSHDGPILAMQLWRTPLFRSDAALSDEVLVVTTEPGRIFIYKHSPHSEKRISASTHYYVRGMRFDRIALTGTLRALAMVEDGPDFVAADADGRLHSGRLTYLDGSIDRKDPEQRDAFDIAPGPALPGEMWARLHHLFAASDLDAPIHTAPVKLHERERLKRELCELVRVDGGPLALYALREQLLFQEPWTALGPEDLTAKAHQLLRGLDPANLEDAERIKVILTSLCDAFLHRNLQQLRAELVGLQARPEWHAETAAMCEIVLSYLARDLGDAPRAAARLRAVMMEQLLRVTTFHHMASEDPEGVRVMTAVAAALDSCLRDDDRLVRIQALRAVASVLRDVTIMAELPGHDRERLLAKLFPRGLGSLTWLVELLVSGLGQFPSFTRRSPVFSDAWYHVAAILPLFEIFPDHTLALCDYLIRAGVGTEAVALCFRSLRHRRMATQRKRIEHFYLLSAIDRDEAIERYDRTKPVHQQILRQLKLAPMPGTLDDREARSWLEFDDVEIASHLTTLLDQLARLWGARSPRQLGAIATRWLAPGAPDARFGGQPPVVADLTSLAGEIFHAYGELKLGVIATRWPTFRAPDAPFSALASVVAELATLAVELFAAVGKPERSSAEVRVLERLAELGERHDGRHGALLPLPARMMVSGIVTAWPKLCQFGPPEPGLRVAVYKLGPHVSDDRFASVFELAEPPKLRSGCVIKVLRRFHSVEARRFLEGARFHQQLSQDPTDHAYVVTVVDVIDTPPYLAYVIQRHGEPLETLLTNESQHRWQSIQLAEKLAVHIGRALRATHARGRCHGDVQPGNIQVSLDDDGSIFKLGNFELACADDDLIDGSLVTGALVPACLAGKRPGDDALGQRQWEDIAALSLILYRMLTGQTIAATSEPEQLAAHVRYLAELARKPDFAMYPAGSRLIDALRCIFEPSYRRLDIEEFLSWISSPIHGTRGGDAG